MKMGCKSKKRPSKLVKPNVRGRRLTKARQAKPNLCCESVSVTNSSPAVREHEESERLIDGGIEKTPPEHEQSLPCETSMSHGDRHNMPSTSRAHCDSDQTLANLNISPISLDYPSSYVAIDDDHLGNDFVPISHSSPKIRTPTPETPKLDDSILPELLVESTRAIGSDPNSNLNQLKGRRIVDLAHIISASRKLEDHECPMSITKKGHLSFVREVRKGLSSELIFQCTSCIHKRVIRTDGNTPKSEINMAAAWGMVTLGKGHYHLEELMAIFDIPSPCYSTYQKYEDDIGKSWMATLTTAILEAIEEEISLAILAGDVDSDGVPWITVIIDGGWSHRSYGHSYSAKSGVAVIIGKRTKKLLFVGVRQKYCSVCATAERQETEAPQHTCYKNWDQSSSAMEADILVEGFRLAESVHKIRYKRFIADGDSNVFKQIRERVPYGRSVTKVECTNHLSKNVGKHLHRLADTNSIYKKLLKTKIAKINKYTRWLISINSSQPEPSIAALKSDLESVPLHSFGDHRHCRKEVCYDAGEVEPAAVRLCDTPTDFQVKFAAILHNLSAHGASLLENDTSNLAESYMHLIAKFTGGKQCFYGGRGSYMWRAYAAGLAFQHGSNWHASAWKAKTKRSPGVIMKDLINKRTTSKNAVKRSLLKDFEDGTLAANNKKVKLAPPSLKNPDYGANCEKPDMDPNDIEKGGQNILKILQVDPKVRGDIEVATRGQASNDRWFAERNLRITCSTYGEICHRRAPPGPLVKRLLYSVPPVNSPPLVWGRDHEAVAVRQYCETTGQIVVPCGLFVDLEKGFLAGSPDGLIGDDKLLEVKCPYKWRFKTPLDAAGDKEFFATIEDNKIKLKQTHNYFYQVQGQLRVSGRQSCDFVIWTTLGMSIENIPRNEKFIDEMVVKLERFYMSAMILEIVDPRVQRSMPIRDTAPKRIPKPAKQSEDPQKTSSSLKQSTTPQTHTSQKRK